jgi:hypothetical protein
MTTMTTTMTKLKVMTRKKLRNLHHSVVHPARSLRHLTQWSIALLVCLTCAGAIAGYSRAPEISTRSADPQKRPSPDDCILYVTVFTQKGVRLPDAAYVAHAAGKKRPHWEGYADSRGEFAVRVSVQGDYEIEVKAKGYAPQTKKVTSEIAEKLDVVFNLVPATSRKP